MSTIISHGTNTTSCLFSILTVRPIVYANSSTYHWTVYTIRLDSTAFRCFGTHHTSEWKARTVKQSRPVHYCLFFFPSAPLALTRAFPGWFSKNKSADEQKERTKSSGTRRMNVKVRRVLLQRTTKIMKPSFSSSPLFYQQEDRIRRAGENWTSWFPFTLRLPASVKREKEDERDER